MNTPTLCSYQHHTHYHVGVTAVLGMDHRPNNIRTAVVLWSETSDQTSDDWGREDQLGRNRICEAGGDNKVCTEWKLTQYTLMDLTHPHAHTERFLLFALLLSFFLSIFLSFFLSLDRKCVV